MSVTTSLSIAKKAHWGVKMLIKKIKKNLFIGRILGSKGRKPFNRMVLRLSVCGKKLVLSEKNLSVYQQSLRIMRQYYVPCEWSRVAAQNSDWDMKDEAF
jgi:hypothetical protein